MADKTTQLILEGLNRAVMEPDGLPLHGSKTNPGMFTGTATAKQAAQRCVSENLVTLVHAENRGKGVQEFFKISEKGLAFLLDEANPKHLLEDFVRALETRHEQMNDLVAQAGSAQAGIAALKEIAEKVLLDVAQQNQRIIPTNTNGVASVNGNGHAGDGLLHHLIHWKNTDSPDDCPLPELYHRSQQTHKTTIGAFHDELRRLHDAERIYLHPWTGPLYELPAPPFALLIGHEIVYYASLRDNT